MLPYSDKKKISPQDVIRFPWEEKTIESSEGLIKPRTREEIKATFDKIDKQSE